MWFFALIAALIVVSYIVFPYKQIAMWFGFAVAGYSSIANDSIQTLGTFLSSNKTVRRIILWIFIAGILVLTNVFGWIVNNGDIAYGRLSSIPQPDVFTFATLSGPIILIILTRFRMPVSTTFFNTQCSFQCCCYSGNAYKNTVRIFDSIYICNCTLDSFIISISPRIPFIKI